MSAGARLAGGALALVAAGGAYVLVARAGEPAEQTPAVLHEEETLRAAPTLIGSARAPETPPPVAPAAASTRTADERPSEARLKALEGWVPEPRIEGIVFRGAQPLRGATVRLRSMPKTDFPASESSPEPPIATVQTGEDGTFAFSDVPRGVWMLELEPTDAVARYTGVPVSGVSPRVVAFLGANRVSGRVFDRLGRAASGIPVEVWVAPPHRRLGATFTAVATTGANGWYAVDALPPGPYVVRALLGPDPVSGGTHEETSMPDEHETIRVDLGSDRPQPVWRGVVRGRDGKPAPGPDNIYLAPHGERSIAFHLPYDEQGRFARRVLVGTYDVRVGIAGRTVAATAPLDLTGDLTQDVVVGGTRVRATVRGPKGAPVRDRHEYLLLAPEGRPNASFGELLGEDGAATLEAVPPGRYTVSGVKRTLVDGAGSPAVIDVPAEPVEVEFEFFSAVDGVARSCQRAER